MTDKKRITINCWNCHRHYSWLATLDGAWELYTTCPFCGAEAVIRLKPWVTTVRDVPAGEGAPLTLDMLNLPDVVPSEPRPGKESA